MDVGGMTKISEKIFFQNEKYSLTRVRRTLYPTTYRGKYR